MSKKVQSRGRAPSDDRWKRSAKGMSAYLYSSVVLQLGYRRSEFRGEYKPANCKVSSARSFASLPFDIDCFQRSKASYGPKTVKQAIRG